MSPAERCGTAASWFRRPRRLALVRGAGLFTMWSLTTAFAALPLLSRFAAAGLFGVLPGLLIRTAYQSTATPVMVYAIPALVWWTLVRLTRTRAMRPAPVEAAPLPLESAEGA